MIKFLEAVFKFIGRLVSAVFGLVFLFGVGVFGFYLINHGSLCTDENAENIVRSKLSGDQSLGMLSIVDNFRHIETHGKISKCSCDWTIRSGELSATKTINVKYFVEDTGNGKFSLQIDTSSMNAF